MNQTAYLNNHESYAVFSFRGRNIRFLTYKNLVRFERIKEWDHGYIVVDCIVNDASGNETIVEDYIDLVPILENLLIDPDQFLAEIKEVQIGNDDEKDGRHCGSS